MKISYRKWGVRLLTAAFFLAVFFVFNLSHAFAADHLVINEIYSDPATGEIEWVELFNSTLSDVSLTGWRLCDGTCNTTFLGANLTGTVSAGGYRVLEKGTGKDFTFGLNNNGDIVYIKNGTEIIDQVIYGNWGSDAALNAPAPPKGKSISRIPNGQDTDNDKADFKVTSTTKGAPYIPQVYSDDIIINEVLPTPDNGANNEFVELYNKGLISVDLTEWQVDDEEGGSSPYTIGGLTIDPGQYLYFLHSETSIALNDDGDSARLIDPNGEVKSMISYDKGINGQSYSLFDSGWSWTKTLTPGAENVMLTDQPIIQNDESLTTVISIAAARGLSDDETVIVSGTVSTTPGTLSDSYFYIQDTTAGLQIYSYHKTFPTLSVGDVIQATGILSSVQNERRLKIDSNEDIIILSRVLPPEPSKVTIPAIGEPNEGTYIVTTGTVTETSGDQFTIADRGKEIKVIIKSGTNIDKPKMRKGDEVQIAGIVSQYKDEYRILPTKQSDVIILDSETLPVAGPNELAPLILGTIFYAIYLLLKHGIDKIFHSDKVTLTC